MLVFHDFLDEKTNCHITVVFASCFPFIILPPQGNLPKKSNFPSGKFEGIFEHYFLYDWLYLLGNKWDANINVIPLTWVIKTLTL